MEHSKNSSKRNVYSKKCLPQKQVNLKQPNLTPKAIREIEMKPNVSRRNKIIKIRAEINEIKTNYKKKDKVSICAWIYLWAFYFIPLINISVFVPVPYCLDNCGFVVEPEVR